MQNRNSSARTAAQKSSKSPLLQRPAIILAMLLLCAVLSTQAQTIMPIPIPMGGGHLPPIAGLAMWMVVDIAIVIGLFIRFLLIKKDRRFLYQSKFKNFFYELNDDTPQKQKELDNYDWYVYCKPDFNFLMIGLFVINCLAGLVALSLLVYGWMS
jgi:hypothetical protein